MADHRQQELGNSGSDEDREELSDEEEEVHTRPCLFRYSTVIARIWGLLTCVALWAATGQMLTEMSKYGYMPWYGLFLSIVVTFLEVVWLINKCACCRDDGCCCTVWKILVWVDDWKKALVYILLSIPCFLRGSVEYITFGCGAMMIVLGVFYFAKSFRHSKCVERRPKQKAYVKVTSPKTRLVPHKIQTPVESYSATGSVASDSTALEPDPVNDGKEEADFQREDNG